MEISFITEYISPISLIICLVVGFIIKTCTYNEKLHKFIPCIVAVIGVVICCWDALAFTPGVVAAGLISGLASTGLYEALSNILNLVDTKYDFPEEEIPEDQYADEDDIEIKIEGTD